MQGEYRGDFTRDSFNPLKHFSRVLKQQGRVDLEADWNEQTSILLHYVRKAAAALIGRHGGANAAFSVQKLTLQDGNAPLGDFIIGLGDYYVDGLLCENNSPILAAQKAGGDEKPSDQVFVLGGFRTQPLEGLKQQYVEVLMPAPAQNIVVEVQKVSGQALALPSNSLNTVPSQLSLRPVITYLTQPNLPNPASLAKTSDCLVYLDVWEQHVSALQDDTIREAALGGPDTATRAKVVWQVKIQAKPPDGLTMQPTDLGEDKWPTWTGLWQPGNRGLLKARVRPQAASFDPCTISPESKYRGPENQLYRVEIHTAGEAWDGSFDSNAKPKLPANPATFKWSRENGSVIFPTMPVSKGTNIVKVACLGRDERLSLAEGDWVEIVDDDYALLESDRNSPVALHRVESVDRTNLQITLNSAIQGETGTHPEKHPFLRRWDHKESDSKQGGLTLQDGAALVRSTFEENSWLDLEDGIQIQFQPGATYRPGDYWLIPARVATGDIEWPRLLDLNCKPVLDANKQPIPDALPPHGVEHHYAPLAVISVNDQGVVVGNPTPLRRIIKASAQAVP